MILLKQMVPELGSVVQVGDTRHADYYIIHSQENLNSESAVLKATAHSNQLEDASVKIDLTISESFLGEGNSMACFGPSTKKEF